MAVLEALKNATDRIDNTEQKRRSKSLHELGEKDELGRFSEEQCRALDDAVFAFLHRLTQSS